MACHCNARRTRAGLSVSGCHEPPPCFESEQVRTSQVEGTQEGRRVQLHACISSLTSPTRHLELLRATVSMAREHPTQMMLSDPSCVPCFRALVSHCPAGRAAGAAERWHRDQDPCPIGMGSR